MDLIIRNRIIRTPIKQILTKLRSDCDNYYLSYIGDQKGSDLKITCPFHKNGQESHPSCHVYCDYSNDKIYYGTLLRDCGEPALDYILDKCDAFVLPGGTYCYENDEYIINYAE